MLGSLARLFLNIAGWEAVGTRIADHKIVLVAGPHTSNWDLLALLAITWALDVKVSWLGKHSMFWWPLGPILRGLGGIPVRRDRPENAVEQIVRAFDEAGHEYAPPVVAVEDLRRHPGLRRGAGVAGLGPAVHIGFRSGTC